MVSLFIAGFDTHEDKKLLKPYDNVTSQRNILERMQLFKCFMWWDHNILLNNKNERFIDKNSLSNIKYSYEYKKFREFIKNFSEDNDSIDYSILDSIVLGFHDYVEKTKDLWQNIYDPEWWLFMQTYLIGIISDYKNNFWWKVTLVSQKIINEYEDYMSMMWENIYNSLWGIIENIEKLESLPFDISNYWQEYQNLIDERNWFKEKKELIEEFYCRKWLQYLYYFQELINGSINQSEWIKNFYNSFSAMCFSKDILDILFDDIDEEDDL